MRLRPNPAAAPVLAPATGHAVAPVAVGAASPGAATYVLGHSNPTADLPPASGWHKEDGHLSPSAANVARTQPVPPGFMHGRVVPSMPSEAPLQPPAQPPALPPAPAVRTGTDGSGASAEADTGMGERAAAVVEAAEAVAVPRDHCDAPSTVLLSQPDTAAAAAVTATTAAPTGTGTGPDATTDAASAATAAAASPPPPPKSFVSFGAPPPAAEMFGLPPTASPKPSPFNTGGGPLAPPAGPAEMVEPTAPSSAKEPAEGTATLAGGFFGIAHVMFFPATYAIHEGATFVTWCPGLVDAWYSRMHAWYSPMHAWYSHMHAWYSPIHAWCPC